MIRIDQRAPVAAGSAVQANRRTGAAGFSVPGRQASAAATAGGGVSAAGSLDLLVAIQAEEDTQDRKRRQARRGHDLLDGLDRLKASLLAGRVPLAELERLQQTLALQRDLTDDPRLDEVLAHIELRTAVELAKLGR